MEMTDLKEGSAQDLLIRREFFKGRVEGASLGQIYDTCYDLWNEHGFNSELVKPPLVLLTYRSPIPWATYHSPDEDCDYAYIGLRPDIYDSGYECFRDTMLHEMCHQYQREILKDTGPSHSRVWLQLAERLGVEIKQEDREESLYSEMKAIALQYDTPVISTSYRASHQGMAFGPIDLFISGNKRDGIVAVKMEKARPSVLSNVTGGIEPIHWSEGMDFVKRDPEHGGLAGTCGGCPFNDGMNEEASVAQSYGCLPTAGEIMMWKRKGEGNWGCHSENKVCTGLCHAAKVEGLPMSEGVTIRDPSHHNYFGEEQ